MEDEDFQTKETVNFWPGFSDMFLVLFVIVMVAFGTYRAKNATNQHEMQNMQDILIEQEASALLRLINKQGYYRRSDDEDDNVRKPVLAMKLYRASQDLKELYESGRMGDSVALDDNVEINTDNYEKAILSFGELVKIKEMPGMEGKGSFESLREDMKLKTIGARLQPGIGKKILTKEELEKLLQEREFELAKAEERIMELSKSDMVPVSQLAQCENERDHYKNILSQYRNIFGDLPIDQEDAKKCWVQVKNLRPSGDGTLVFVDEQFKRALEMFVEATEGKTIMIKTPDLVVSAMKKLAESITGGQFDIVNSMLGESEVKFEVARPTYSQIDSVSSKNDFRKVYGDDKAFKNEEQWDIARSALLKKVITGFDSGVGDVRKHMKGIVDMLKDHPTGKITVDIIGYTDMDGEYKNNNDLGMRRAKFIAKIIEILLQNELERHNGLAADDCKRVEFQCFSAGEFGLPKQNSGESLDEYKARCRRIAVTVKVDSSGK